MLNNTLGGRLSTSVGFLSTGSYLVAFGNRLYLYDETGRKLSEVFQTHSNLLAFSVDEEHYTCVDSTGHISRFNEDR